MATQYIFHEFFHIKDRRKYFRGHLSRYGNVLWSVPLRIFYWQYVALKESKSLVCSAPIVGLENKVVFTFFIGYKTATGLGASKLLTAVGC